MVTDVPSNHDDRKVPILDLKCWIAEVKPNTGTSNMILHEHYVKEVSSKMVLHSNYVYTGQTGLNAYARGKKHDQEYKAKNDESASSKHCVSVHNGELQVFKMSVVDKCRNDPTKREILESVRLQKVPVERVMNSRSEWNSARLPRICASNEGN